MRNILEKLANVYPDLREKRVLIIDDEADYASVSFRKHAEAVEIGRISSQIDELRNIVKKVDYLQVTATPYSLYLQPNTAEEKMEFLPKRPAFNELVPPFEGYIGGDFYFNESADEESIGHEVFEEVPLEERDILKEPDERRLKLEDVLTSNKIAVLRKAVMNFIVGAVIRRLQQKSASKPQEKYAFVAHSERYTHSHGWQYKIISELISRFAKSAREKSAALDMLINDSYLDIKKSAEKISNLVVPSSNEVNDYVLKSLIEEHIMITTVNAEQEVEELLDNQGQLKLRNPMNIFIGGQILDRVVTINNLIGFYYGRKPTRFQQDTVLQHSRMYGDRSREDLAVTRFYTTRDIYEVMSRIHEFDSALRDAFEKGGNSRGVYFIRKDVTGKLVPCSPNKLSLSSLTTLRPNKSLLPIGFETGFKTHIADTVEQIDQIVSGWFNNENEQMPILVTLDEAIKVVDLISKTLELNELYPFSWKTFKASMEHLSLHSKNEKEQKKVWVLVRRNRQAPRERDDKSRFYDSPHTSTGDRALSREVAVDTPVLGLFHQKGSRDYGWRGTPFWWPVLSPPQNTEVTIFAEETI